MKRRNAYERRYLARLAFANLLISIFPARRALKKINDTIYAQGAPVGTKEYFEIRGAVCDVLYPWTKEKAKKEKRK